MRLIVTNPRTILVSCLIDGFDDTNSPMNDYYFLKDLFALLDTKLDFLVAEIKSSDDPDGMGLLDDAEYIIGIGMIAAQRFLTSAYGCRSIFKKDALTTGPLHRGGQPYAKIINAAANYWKHVDEWDLGAVVHRDKSELESVQSKTMTIIESVTQWTSSTALTGYAVGNEPAGKSDYILASLLNDLIGEPKLSPLLPILQQWSDELESRLQ